MRMHIDDHMAYAYDVLLDGVLLKDCTYASEEEGCAIVRPPGLCELPPGLRTKMLYGKVQIVLRPDHADRAPGAPYDLARKGAGGGTTT